MLSLYFKDDYYFLSFFSSFLIKVVSTIALMLLCFSTVIFLFSASANLRYAGILFLLILLEKLLFLNKSRKSLKNLPLKGKVNVADYIAPRVKEIVVTALQKNKEDGQKLSIAIMLEVLDANEVQEAIRRLGVDIEELKSKIIEVTNNKRITSKDDITKNIELMFLQAFESALKIGEESITPADLLITQFVAGDETIKKVFKLFEIVIKDLEKALIFGRLVRTKPVSHTSFFASRIPVRKIRTINRAWTSRPTPTLDKFGDDITDMAIVGKSGFLVGHTSEYERVHDILSRPTKPNVLLIGDPGIGKEAIIGHLAYKIIKDQVSPQLFDKRIVALDIGSLISGADEDELRARVNKIVHEIITAGNVILYIRDIHNLARTSARGVMSAADVLIPAIKQDTFSVIGATYPREYKKNIEQDSSFASVFESVQIEEISEEEAEEYLSYDSVILEREWKIEISFAAIKKAVKIAKKYFHNKPLPSSAEDLLKEALAEASRREDKILGEDDIIRAAEKRINIPMHQANIAEAKSLLNLEQKIHERIINQEEAVRAVASSLREYRSGLSRQQGPIASFLFVGPTGVGKTELAKALATIQFGSENMMIRFDMSEYQGPDSITRLIGGDNGKIYGSLTEAVLEKPYSLILLDELEKAHGSVLNLFLQVLDDGRLTDGVGKTVDFQNTIIIATSNAHSSLIKESLENNMSFQALEVMLKKRLIEYFKPELLNRFSNIIAFKTLSIFDIKKIARLQLNALTQMLSDNQGIIISFEDDAVNVIAKEGYDPVFGARPLRGAISKLIKDPLSSMILSGNIKRGDNINVVADGSLLTFRNIDIAI